MGGIGIFQSAVQEMRRGIIKLAVSFHGLLSGSLFCECDQILDQFGSHRNPEEKTVCSRHT